MSRKVNPVERPHMNDEFIKEYGEDTFLDMFEYINNSPITRLSNLTNRYIQIVTKDYIDLNRCYGFVLIDGTILLKYKNNKYNDSLIVEYGENVSIPDGLSKSIRREILINRSLK